MRTRFSTLVLAALVACLAAPLSSQAGDPQEWADGVPYVTDYEAAIKEARTSGRMLLIYNGWKREGI